VVPTLGQDLAAIQAADPEVDQGGDSALALEVARDLAVGQALGQALGRALVMGAAAGPAQVLGVAVEAAVGQHLLSTLDR
jgi:hypothetical protein